MKTNSNNFDELPVEGDAVTLRSLSVDDAEELYELVCSNRKYLSEFLPFPAKTKEVADSLGFIKMTIDQREYGSAYGFGIMKNGRVIGHTTLMHIGEKERLPEIGYWIAESESGKGIVSHTTKALTDFGLEVLGLPKIVIKADPKNTASNRIPEKLGYKLTGQKVDPDSNIGSVHNVWECTV